MHIAEFAERGDNNRQAHGDGGSLTWMLYLHCPLSSLCD